MLFTIFLTVFIRIYKIFLLEFTLHTTYLLEKVNQNLYSQNLKFLTLFIIHHTIVYILLRTILAECCHLNIIV